MDRLWESIFGLKYGFLNQDGELSVGFNPKWPTEALVNAGSWNWLLGLMALAGLAYLFARLHADVPPRRAWQRRIAAAVGLLAVIVVGSTVGIGTAVLLAIIVAAVEFLAPWRWKLRLARVLVIGFIFILLSGTVAFNVALAVLAVALLFYVYPREGRATSVRVTLGVMRAALLAFVIALLNRPVLNLGQDLVDPSVLAILVDDSISMSVRDVRPDDPENSPSRLDGVIEVLTRDDQALLRKLAEQHQVRFYEFDGTARQVGPAIGDGRGEPVKEPVKVAPELAEAIRGLKPEGQTTAVLPSLLGVMEELQGQRVAGIVLITDGVETAGAAGGGGNARARTDETLKRLREFHANVYPIAVGSEKAPTNLEVQSVNVQDAVFVDDIVLFRMTVRGSGYPANHPIKVALRSAGGGPALKTADGKPAERTVSLPDDNPLEVELQFKPDQIGTLEVEAVVEKQAGELDARDNVRPTQIAVLDAQVNVLYVDGYPRWEYRYLKNEMIRDKTVNISLLLTSADPAFAQEGDPPVPESGPDVGTKFPGPIRRFPENMEELMKYDVVVFGDVDPRQFSDAQLQLVNEFVSKKGGGFGMVAGPRWSPQAFRNSPLEAVLPVVITDKAQADTDTGVITEGFRPVLTKTGAASSVFRFFPDRAANEKFVAEQIEPLFWYCRGLLVKPGVGEVYAEHPIETGPDGRKALLLVLGRFGAGRTLFSAIDDTWRWRYYTGETIFDTYWVQQLRHLARSRKIGQRRFNFNTDRDTYTLGEPVRIDLSVLDPVLAQQLPRELDVEVRDDAGQVVRRERLERQETPPDAYAASFTADKVGRYTVRLPATPGTDDKPVDVPVEVIVPRLELARPAVDMALLRQVAAKDEKTGQPIVLDLSGAAKLPELIRSAARTIPLVTAEPLWDAPLAFLIFIVLLTAEWVLRKMYGML